MSGPDGPEERTAYYQEYFLDDDMNDLLADEAVDESLIEMARERLESLGQP